MMTKRPSLPVVLLALGAASVASAYELTTHEKLSVTAVDESVLVKNPSVLRDMGLSTVTEKIFDNNRRSILDVVGGGARLEDTLTSTRPIHHFFDPTRAGDSTNGALRLPVPVFPTYSSPTWALADRGPVNGQEYSFRNARTYLLNALTLSAKAERDAAFAKMFQTLGMIIHHLQDMAQPQHVRNDLHCGESFCRPFFHNPSAYESYTEKRIVGSIVGAPIPSVTGYPSVYTAANASILNTPRKLWYTGDGKGIAEFTNRNFVTDGTNFKYDNFSGNVLPDDRYGFPLPSAGARMSIADAYASRVIPPRVVPAEIQSFCGVGSTCMIEFYGTTGVDSLTGQPVNNSRASSLSIFDHELRLKTVTLTTSDSEKTYSTSRIFALNSFNFDSANTLLLRRAVGYSAGLIDYYFRGKLETEGQGANQILVKNASAEAMLGDFALYYDDAQTVRRPITITTCSVGGVAVAVEEGKCKGAALAAASPNASEPLQVTFALPTDPAPKDAGEYLVVFTGDLGEEKAGNGNIGAVVAKQIRTVGGALYVSARDNQGRQVFLRADTSGTKVITPGDGQFNPLLFLVPQSLQKAYSLRQVRLMQTGPGVYSYEPLALTIGSMNHSPQSIIRGFVKNSSTNTFESTGTGESWTAKSSQPEIGEFVFTHGASDVSPTGVLKYTRRYRGTDGNLATATGTIALPSRPGSRGWTFPSGEAFVSDDGLTIVGYRETTAGSSQQDGEVYYDLKITLGETPSVSTVERSRESAYSFTGSEEPLTTTISEPISTIVPCLPAGQQDFTYNLRRMTYRGNSNRRFSTTLPIAYLNDNLIRYRLTESLTYAASGETIGVDISVGCNVGVWKIFHYKGNTEEKRVSESQVSFGVGVHTSISDVVIEHHMPIAPYNRTWDFNYEGPVESYPKFQYTNTKQSTNNGIPNISVVRALTDRLEDAVVTQMLSTPITLFRNNDITGKTFVADASPLGEIFFATTDLSIVIHEPKGGAPKVAIPSNVVRILSAVWF